VQLGKRARRSLVAIDHRARFVARLVTDPRLAFAVGEMHRYERAAEIVHAHVATVLGAREEFRAARDPSRSQQGAHAA
jgi:hypothetical protein